MASASPKKLALIIGSTRAIRVGPAVVDFVHKVFLSSPVTPKPGISIIDVAKFNLPIFNERVVPTMVPAHGGFEYEHSKAWSAAIASFDAYIWVSAEYNVGVPGGLKNAIDCLFHELVGKPAWIVTYGIAGGKRCSESLKSTLAAMTMKVVETLQCCLSVERGLDDGGHPKENRARDFEGAFAERIRGVDRLDRGFCLGGGQG